MGVTHLDKAFNQQQYQENIRKLRSGTALESAEFIEFLRERYAVEFGNSLSYAIVDPTIFEEQDYEEHTSLLTQKYGKNSNKTNPQDEENTKTYSPQAIRKLKSNIHQQIEQLAVDDQTKKAFIEELNNDSPYHEILNEVDENNATAWGYHTNDKTFSVVTYQDCAPNYLKGLQHITGWNITDMKYKGTSNPLVSLSSADHEMGHAVFYDKLGQEDPFPEKSDDYNTYIHETFADSFDVLSAVHDGESIDFADVLAAERAYSTLLDSAYTHFTCPTLMELKNHVDEEYIRSLPNKQAVADYCLKFILGDEHEGREPCYLSEEAYNKQVSQLKSITEKVETEYLDQAKPIPTPLQFKQMIDDDTGLFSEEEKEIINRYIVPHKETLLHKADVERGLINQEVFDNPQTLYKNHKQAEFLQKTPQTAFEQELLDQLLPKNENGHRTTLDTDEQVYKIDKHLRAIENSAEDTLDCGTHKITALDTLYEYRSLVLELGDPETVIHPHERAREFVTLDKNKTLLKHEAEQTLEDYYHER